MKRSEINAALSWAKDLLASQNIRLPELAYLSPDRARARDLSTVKAVMLGWDITDFGTGDFDKVGAVLYTVRNGLLADPSVGVPYCEKYILMKPGQRLPEHYHVFKTEDIIVRAGGTLKLNLWNTDEAGRRLSTPVHVFMDGFEHVYAPGEDILVAPGCSVSLTPHLSHIFGPAEGSGDLVIGEVSKVNDDNTDNYFLEPTSRFAAIEEDAPALHLLCNEY